MGGREVSEHEILNLELRKGDIVTYTAPHGGHMAFAVVYDTEESTNQIWLDRGIEGHFVIAKDAFLKCNPRKLTVKELMNQAHRFNYENMALKSMIAKMKEAIGSQA